MAEAAIETESERINNFFETEGKDIEYARVLYQASKIEDPQKFSMCMAILKAYFDSRLAAKSEDARPLAFFGQYAGKFGEMLKDLVEQGKNEVEKLNINTL
jgi:hypothetical protein